MSYLVTAGLVLALDQEGHTIYHYEGDVIGWLSPAQEKHFLDEKLVTRLDGPAAVLAPLPEEYQAPPGSDEQKVGGPALPPKVATNAVLADWLVQHRNANRAEVTRLTKDELWALIEGSED